MRSVIDAEVTPASKGGRRDEVVWQPFVVAAIAMALSGGFALGAVLFAARWRGDETGGWWIAAAQAHGQVQMLGWLGLMVLGVVLHFLPRLAGAPLRWPRAARGALWLIIAGLVLRSVAQPLRAAGWGTWPSVGLSAAAGLVLVGVSVAVGLLLATVLGAAPRKGGALRPVLPLFLVSFGSLWVAAGLNAYGLVQAARGAGVIPGSLDRVVVTVEFYGFLVPVAAAMTARTFPLYFQTHPPRVRLLAAALVGIVGGLALRVSGDPTLVGVGQALHGLALSVVIVALRVFGPRRPLPRRPVRPLRDPLQLHALSAYGWLATTALVTLMAGACQRWPALPSIPADVEWHALGAGFATLLILGVGAHMLPGFARREVRSHGLLWATLALGNLAALLRITAGLAGGTGAALGGTAGVLGLLAVALFAVNLYGRRR